LTGSAPANGAIEEFFAFFQQRLSVYPDTLDTLKRLRSRTIPLGILTDVPYGMPREFVQRDLGAGGISGLIDVLLTSVDVGVRKPETAGYLALAERLGVTPGEMLYVGNEPKDVIGAGRAGLQSAFINRAGVGGDHGQQFTVSTLNAIAEIVIAAEWSPRLATENDIADLEELIPISARALQAPFYSRAQIGAALGPIFGVDTQLIRDGTYFVVEHEGRIIGCGGWSRRKSMYGGDGQRAQSDPELDPQRDAARVRAFFVHPRWARRGIGRSLMNACEQAIAAAGFRNVEIAATLAGEPLYASFGYVVTERCEVAMANGLKLPVARMTRTFGT
jgi:FMN phosphatase YigB (HAD superfamily)